MVRAHDSRAEGLPCGRSTVRVRLDALTECSLTVHPAANGYLAVTPGEIKAARKGIGHPTSHADGSG